MRFTAASASVCLAMVSLSVGGESWASVRMPTNIPAEDLGPALQTLAKERGFQIVYETSKLKSLKTRGASGDLSPQEALTELLKGTGFTYRYVKDNGVSIVPIVNYPISGAPGVEPMAPSDQAPAALQGEQSAKGGEGVSSGTFRLAQADQGKAANSASVDQSMHQVGDTEGGQLAEVVVTAARRSENLQDVPIAVTAVSGDTLKDLSIDSGLGLPLITPGLAISAGGGNTATYIRGVGTTFANLGLESSVATYLDDLYVPRPVSGYYSLSDLDHVEVLEGPQGTLYGRNATGGAIKLITNDPDTNFAASTSATIGSFHRAAATGMLNVPIGNAVQARVTVDYDTDDGYVKNLAGGRDGQDDDVLSLRLKLKAEPTDFLTVKLTAGYSVKDDNNGATFGSLYGAPQQMGIAQGGRGSTGFYNFNNGVQYSNGGYGRYANFFPYLRVRGTEMVLKADMDLGFATLTSISGWFRSQMDEATAVDATSLPLAHDIFDEDTDSYSQEFDVVSKGDGPFSWTGGLYYYYERGHSLFDVFGTLINEAFAVPNNPNTGGYDGGAAYDANAHINVESFAPFAQLSYDFTSQLGLTLGGRWTTERKTLPYNSVYEQDIFANGLNGAVTPLFSQSGVDAKFNNFSPRAVLSYKVTHDALVYLSYSDGFKSGGINTPSFGPAQTVKPELLHSLELGWKTEFSHLRFNGDVYYYRYQDLQVQFSDVKTGASLFENAASARIYGLQSDVLYEPTAALQFGLGGNYLNTKFQNYIGSENVPASQTAPCTTAGGGLALACQGFATQGGIDFSGTSLPLAPTFTGYLRGRYNVSLNQQGSLAFNSLLSYSGSYHYNAGALLIEPSHYLLSAGIAWKSPDEHFQIRAFGNNVLDQHYALFRAVAAYGGIIIPAAPATWGVSLAYKL